MDTVVEMVKSSHASTPNHSNSVTLLGETKCEHDKIIYHTNVRKTYFATVFELLKKIKLFMEKHNKRTEEVDDKGPSTLCANDSPHDYSLTKNNKIKVISPQRYQVAQGFQSEASIVRKMN
jgi:hypothetical protein